MNEPLSTEPYKGVRDFYPLEWAALQAIFTKAREVLTRFGYEEYNASPLERAELYESKTSEEILNEQTYTFTDRGDRRVTLRPEMTPTLARMVAGKRRELVYPLRWFSIGNRFRYERPQRGRLREFYQIDVDLLGIKDAKADGEILTIAHALLTAYGATNRDFVIRVNSRALLNEACTAAGLTADQSAAYLHLLDRKAKMSEPEYAAALGAITTIDPLSLIEKNDARIAGEKQKIEGLLAALASRGIENAVFDPLIVRGFDYYTGIVFEMYDTNSENPRALFGGGRYDNLLSYFGGEPLPAVGFAVGDVGLVNFLETHNLRPSVSSAPLIYLGTPSENDIASAQNVATELRTQGLSVLVNVTDRSLGDQIKEADRRGIPYFAAVGEDEKASGILKMKKLATGEEHSLEIKDVVHYVVR